MTVNQIVRTLTIASIATVLPMVTSITAHAAGPELNINYKVPKQNNQVAFVPFAGDRLISNIVLNDLNNTELTTTTNNLPQKIHSSYALAGTLGYWQQLGIPYLVIGATSSNNTNVNIEFEIIELQSGRIIGGKQVLQSSRDNQSMRYAAHVVADRIYEAITGTPGDFSGRIAYIEEVGKGDNKISELKVIDADGENPRTVTRITGSIFSPAWSPNGRQLAYAAQVPNGYPVIYLQDVDGGQPQLVTPYRGINLSPSFSPDGRKLLFSSSFQGNADIYQMDLTSGKTQRLVKMPSNEVQPDYAPDGRSFVFVSDRTGENRPQIYRYDLTTTQISRVSRNGYATSPKFNHSGSQIAYLRGRSAAIMNNSGTTIKNLGTTGIDESASFSPNGKRVVYASKQGGRGVLTIRSLVDDTRFGKSTQGIIRSPVWSAAPK